MAPMQVSLRSAMGVLKDQTSISLAKVASAGVADLEVAIVKATSHDDTPMEEKYVQEVLHLTSYSRSYVSSCVQAISKRLSKTHDWIVALKALMLAHRLLRDGDSAFEQELTLSGRRGLHVLNASDFRDEAHSNGWDFSAFIHAYGLYLDERLDCTSIGSFASWQKQGRRSPYNESRYDYSDTGRYNDAYGSRDSEDQGRLAQQQQSKAIKDMKPEELLESFPFLQRALDRVLACRPTGMAKVNRLVNIALYLVVRESFVLYTDIRDGLAILLDAFFDMEPRECSKVFDIYSRAAKQIDDLISFYSFCKALGICRTTEYPTVEKVSDEMLETMEDFLRNRSDADRGFRRPRSPVPRASSPRHEATEEADYEMNGIKALPAPPLPANESVTAVPSAKPNPVSVNNDDRNADFININEPAVSMEEHENKLALALFSGSETKVNSKWESFSANEDQSTASVGGTGALGKSNNDAAGWELALLDTESDLSKPSGKTLAGGFNNLLLDSLYEQGLDRQKTLTATAPSGSASSVAMPGRSQSNFLALPAPPAAATALSDDPFAASVSVPPPAYVQMSELTQKQQLLVQEQQQWIQYQQAMMQGHIGMMKFPSNPYAASFQPAAYPVSYYGMNPYYR
ncbi:hypothetical protein GOP47_0022271 [Adiantum capillus-veneris]|uniref:ENTH domain-containing protein n=1 Tax=Adiantum capillus-veneris TaxID=13818 RepID=A0A9D4U906_ADICA|nr:hypothetical protein GOP47_0022271 [Adiantum capillus-veneris]